MPAATSPWIAQAVDWALGAEPGVSDQPPEPPWERRRKRTPPFAALEPPVSACRTEPVESGSLPAPGTAPQPPSSACTRRSQASERETPAPEPLARSAMTAKAVELGHPW